MQVCYQLEQLPQFAVRPVVSVGNFDGVHLGHQALITTLAQRAEKLNAPALALTFHPHPLVLLRADKIANMIISLEERCRLLNQFGVHTVLCLPFNQALADVSAEDFIARILVEKLKTRELVEGFNFNFGKRGKGNVDMLRALGPGYDYIVHQVGPVMVEDEPVSSSRVRRAVQAGNFILAGRLLGRPWRIWGQVVHGAGRGGRELDTPTANLQLEKSQLLPPQGVYAAQAFIPGGRAYPALFNLGLNPTFSDLREPRLEVHLLEYKGDLYGQKLQVEPLAFLRTERKFASPGELRLQMAEDIAQARQLFPG